MHSKVRHSFDSNSPCYNESRDKQSSLTIFQRYFNLSSSSSVYLSGSSRSSNSRQVIVQAPGTSRRSVIDSTPSFGKYLSPCFVLIPSRNRVIVICILFETLSSLTLHDNVGNVQFLRTVQSCGMTSNKSPFQRYG